MRNYLKGGLTVVAALIIVTFAIKNNHSVQLHYYFNTLDIQLPAYALVFISLLIGILIGLFIGWYKGLGLKRQAKQSKQNQPSQSQEHQYEQ